jgi:signal transduction histidine kinase
MWEKIVLNLLSNAFKFTLEGSVTDTLAPVAEGVELSVSDTSTVIPAEELPHIFQRFHRVQGAKSRTFEGTGIGLALIGELVKLHGGRVDVQSEMGGGSTFRVYIPFGVAHLPQEGVQTAPTPHSDVPGSDLFAEIFAAPSNMCIIVRRG